MTGPPAPAELDIMPVEHLAEYVIGFPVYVVVTVRAHEDVSFNMLPFADLLNLRACIGADITPQQGGRSVRFQPKPYIDPSSGRRGAKLGPGESRRMLTDVSPYFDNVAEGEYQVRFSYVETDAVYPAAPVRLRFRKPTAAEGALLAAAAPDRSAADSWGAWTITCPGTVYEGQPPAGSPLEFNLLLRRLFCGTEPLRSVDPAMLDVLTGLYEPERNALQAELYRARGDDARYQQLRSRILSETPGLAWWIRMIDDGGAFLKSIRMAP